MLIEFIEIVHTPKAQDKILEDFQIQISVSDLDRQRVIRYTTWARMLVISIREPWNIDRYWRHLPSIQFRVFWLSPNLFIYKSQQHRCREAELFSTLFRSRGKYSCSLKVIPLTRETVTINSISWLEIEPQVLSLQFYAGPPSSRWSALSEHRRTSMQVTYYWSLGMWSCSQNSALNLGSSV